MQNQKLKRQVLQYESNQKLDLSIEEEKNKMFLKNNSNCNSNRKKIFSSNFALKLRKKPDNYWNNLTKMEKKEIEMIVNDLIIKKDIEAFDRIMEKFKKEKQIEEIEKQLKLQRVNEIRENFMSQQNFNSKKFLNSERNFNKERYSKNFGSQNNFSINEKVNLIL